jgi:hypothetical protein
LGLLIILTIPKAIFLHSPDCEFAEIGAKSDIPYKAWFNLFKEFLLKNVKNPNIEALFEFWNGKVFSFDTTNKQGVNADDVDSGMDEAELLLAGRDFSDSDILPPLPARHENEWGAGSSQVNYEEPQFIDTFNNLTIDDPNQPLSESSHTAADLHSASSPHCESEPAQPNETGAQNPAGESKRPSQKAGEGKSNGKGKQKAVAFVDVGLEDEESVETGGTTTVSASRRQLRSKRK